MPRRRPEFRGVGAERVAFVHSEGGKPTVAWRRVKAEVDQAFDCAFASKLASKFNLDPGHVANLAIDLVIVLDPERTPALVAADREANAEHVRAAATTAIKSIGRARDQLCEARDALDGYDADPLVHGAERARLRKLIDALDEAPANLRELLEELRWLEVNDGDAVFATVALDRRRIPDLRRSVVLDCLFRFWSEVGRSLTVTTDASKPSHQRGGQLVDFVNMIVPQLTDPSMKLSAETITKDLKAFKKASSSSQEP